eukprot:5543490-Prymnesium_polylepis.1
MRAVSQPVGRRHSSQHGSRALQTVAAAAATTAAVAAAAAASVGGAGWVWRGCSAAWGARSRTT